MFSKKTNKYFIFNINSAEVSGAVVYFNQQQNKSVIEYYFKEELPILAHDSISEFKKNTTEALNKVLTQMENYLNISDDFFNVKDIHIFLAAPWTQKKINILTDERLEPFVVSEKYFENLFSPQNLKIAEDLILISREDLKIKANNYLVLQNEILDKKILKLDISFLDILIKREDFDFFQEIIKQHFSFPKIKFYPFISTFLQQLKNLYNLEDDFAFLNFTGEVMEFGIYQDNQFKNIVNIASGKNKIIREILKNNLAENFNEARYLFLAYIREEVDVKIKILIDEIIFQEIDFISQEIFSALEKYQIELLPSKLFVISSGEMNYLIKKMSIFKQTYFLGKSYLRTLVEVEEEKYLDNFIALEADYLKNKWL